MKNLILFALTFFLICSYGCDESLVLSDDGVLVPLTVMEDSSLPYISVGGVRLHSETIGNPEDPIILVIHGGPGADYRSQLNFKELAKDNFYVVFYDQRGSGLSERLDKSGFPNVQVYIDELGGVIDHYRKDQDQKVVLAGHSWGAMLATAYINQFPDKIDGAILAEPGGFTWEQTEAYISRSRKLELFGETTNDFLYGDQFLTASDHNTLDYKMALSTAGDVTTGDLLPPPYWRYGAVCSNTSIQLAMDHPEQLDFTKNLNEYDLKILFAYSEHNEAYGLDHAIEVSGHLSNAELVEIKGCGHEIPEFGWDNYYPVMKDYLIEMR